MITSVHDCVGMLYLSVKREKDSFQRRTSYNCYILYKTYEITNGQSVTDNHDLYKNKKAYKKRKFLKSKRHVYCEVRNITYYIIQKYPRRDQ